MLSHEYVFAFVFNCEQLLLLKISLFKNRTMRLTPCWLLLAQVKLRQWLCERVEVSRVSLRALISSDGISYGCCCRSRLLGHDDIIWTRAPAAAAPTFANLASCEPVMSVQIASPRVVSSSPHPNSRGFHCSWRMSSFLWFNTDGSSRAD